MRWNKFGWFRGGSRECPAYRFCQWRWKRLLKFTSSNVDFTFTGSPPFDFSYSDGTTTTSVVGNLTSTFTITAAAAGTYSVTALNDIACVGTSLGSPVTVIVTPVPTAVLSGGTAICAGGSANLTVTLTGTQPWDIIYSDGSTNFPVNGIAASPFTLGVTPLFSTTYSFGFRDGCCLWCWNG